ncbi:MAG: hypothetical protein V8R55_06895 [Dysosmobacter sp.]
MNEPNQAVALMLLSAPSFSLMQAVVKLSATHIGTMEQVFCRNLISMAISFVLLRRSHLPLLGGREIPAGPAGPVVFRLHRRGHALLRHRRCPGRPTSPCCTRTSPIWVSLFALLIPAGTDLPRCRSRSFCSVLPEPLQPCASRLTLTDCPCYWPF